MAPRVKRPYRVLVGLNYGDVRREPGDVVDDLPADSVAWLLAQGCIEPAEPTPAKGGA